MKQRAQYIIILSLLFLSGVSGFLFSLYVHRMPHISSREMINVHSPVSFVKQISGDKDAGRKIFYEFCVSCHSAEPVIAVNAPRINDKKKWDSYTKLGIPALLRLTIQGNGAMPARGGCFECSDEQLERAILYILNFK